MKNWDDMRVFLAVARAESLSAAAPVLQMDPATVSRRIARLEADLGANLFVKSPQGYALTALGLRLQDEVTTAEAALARAADAGTLPSDELSGQIRIGAPDGCANYVLPQVCAKIREQHPALEIQILALPRLVNLSQREADMAITVSPPQAGRLLVQKITDYHLHLAAHHDVAEPDDITGLKDHGLIGYIQDMIFDKELDYLGPLASQGVPMASNSAAVQVQMLRQGAGIGIVHDFALPFAPELRRVLTNHVSIKRAFYLVRHMSDRKSDRLNRVAALISSAVKAEVVRLET